VRGKAFPGVKTPMQLNGGTSLPKSWPQLFWSLLHRAIVRRSAPFHLAWFSSGNGALVRSFLLAMMSADERSR
jgi:hypothetical protein